MGQPDIEYRAAVPGDLEAVCKCLAAHFAPVEPLGVALGITDDPKREWFHEQISADTLKDNRASYVAVHDGEVVGVCLATFDSIDGILTDHSPPVSDSLRDTPDVRTLHVLLEDMEQGLPQVLVEGTLLPDIAALRALRTLCHLHIITVSSSPVYRRQGIGARLVGCVLAACEAAGCQVCLATATAAASAVMLVRKFDARILREISYSTLTRSDGAPIVCPDGCDKACLMLIKPPASLCAPQC